MSYEKKHSEIFPFLFSLLYHVMLALNLYLFNPTLVIIARCLLHSFGIIQFLCALRILQYWKVILQKFQMFLPLAL